MIFPRLCIKDDVYRIELYDIDEPDEPILTMGGTELCMAETLFHLLNMALENYTDGYADGYEDAIEDCGE